MYIISTPSCIHTHTHTAGLHWGAQGTQFRRAPTELQGLGQERDFRHPPDPLHTQPTSTRVEQCTRQAGQVS